MLRSTTPLLALLTLTIGCGPGADLQQELDQARAEVSDLTAQRDALDKENKELTTQVRKLTQDVDRLRRREVYYRLGVDEGDALSTTLQTTRGSIHCALWPDKAPQTVLNFVELAEGSREWTDPRTGRKVKHPLYDGTIFHRVIPGFMIQGGDPLGNGTGGPGYRFEDEVDSGLTFDQPGLLAMANSGPNTNGSQFFITDRSTPDHLNGRHTIFGKCDDLDVVQAIAEVETGSRDRPLEDVVLEHVAIERP